MKVWIASSSRVKEKKYLTLAKEVAEFFSKRDDELICGGINSSMMKEIYETFHKENKKITCVTLAYYNEDLSNLENVKLMDSTFDRTKELYKEMDIAIFLPGGTGSLSELFATLEEHRTIENKKKLILFNYQDFYNPIVEIINQQIAYGFNTNDILDHIEIVETLEELKKKVSELYE